VKKESQILNSVQQTVVRIHQKAHDSSGKCHKS